MLKRLLLLSLVILGAWFVYTRLTTTRVTVVVDESRYEVETNATTVNDVLLELDITLDPVDTISHDLDDSVENNMTITINKAEQLILDVDGDIQRIYTHKSNPVAILDEQGVTLGIEDVLLVNHLRIDSAVLGSIRETPRHLRIIHPKSYSINDNGLIEDGTTTAATVGDLLHDSGYPLYLADQISPPVNTPIYDDITITIERSRPVAVEVDESEVQTRAVGETVGDVLAMLGLQLLGKDYSIPAEEDPFDSDMLIQVIRVSELIEVEEREVPFDIIEVDDPALASGEKRIVQDGQPGLEETRYRVRLENNLQVSRVVQSQTFIQNPVPQIVAVGSN
jgi:uncharacterized protein YabE (DUF348 family)